MLVIEACWIISLWLETIEIHEEINVPLGALVLSEGNSYNWQLHFIGELSLGHVFPLFFPPSFFPITSDNLTAAV